MAEKEGVRKLLILLIVIVVLNLVVNMISLKVLYGVIKESGLRGELGAWWDWFVPWSFTSEAETYYESQTEPMNPEYDRYSSYYSPPSSNKSTEESTEPPTVYYDSWA